MTRMTDEVAAARDAVIAASKARKLSPRLHAALDAFEARVRAAERQGMGIVADQNVHVLEVYDLAMACLRAGQGDPKHFASGLEFVLIAMEKRFPWLRQPTEVELLAALIRDVDAVLSSHDLAKALVERGVHVSTGNAGEAEEAGRDSMRDEYRRLTCPMAEMDDVVRGTDR
jgi:hypothetical protein